MKKLITVEKYCISENITRKDFLINPPVSQKDKEKITYGNVEKILEL